MYVLPQFFAGVFYVSCHRALRDFAVLLPNIPVSGRPDKEDPAIPIVEVQQKAAEMQEERLAATGNERQMEFPMQSLPLLECLRS